MNKITVARAAELFNSNLYDYSVSFSQNCCATFRNSANVVINVVCSCSIPWILSLRWYSSPGKSSKLYWLFDPLNLSRDYRKRRTKRKLIRFVSIFHTLFVETRVISRLGSMWLQKPLRSLFLVADILLALYRPQGKMNRMSLWSVLAQTWPKSFRWMGILVFLPVSLVTAWKAGMGRPPESRIRRSTYNLTQQFAGQSWRLMSQRLYSRTVFQEAFSSKTLASGTFLKFRGRLN